MARSDGFEKILWLYSVTTGRDTLPFAFILKQTVASPSILSRRATEGYFGKAVSAGTRSVDVSIKCITAVDSSPACSALARLKTRQPAKIAMVLAWLFLWFLIVLILPVINLNFRADRIDCVHVH